MFLDLTILLGLIASLVIEKRFARIVIGMLALSFVSAIFFPLLSYLLLEAIRIIGIVIILGIIAKVFIGVLSEAKNEFTVISEAEPQVPDRQIAIDMTKTAGDVLSDLNAKGEWRYKTNDPHLRLINSAQKFFDYIPKLFGKTLP